MKKLVDLINEKLIINSKTRLLTYEYFPRNREELRKLVEKLVNKEGGNANLNVIDTSKVTSMLQLFKDIPIEKPKIDKWNMSNVIDARNMFINCEKFNSDISNWNLKKCTKTSGMFWRCQSFTGDISKWDVSKVTEMNGMFYKCKNFDCDISKWDVSNVKDMENMFNGCESFNKNLDNWDVNEEVETMFMFMNSGLKNFPPKWYKED